MSIRPRVFGRLEYLTPPLDEHAFLTVENTGPTVPGYDVNGLFEPFRRLVCADRLTDSSHTSPGRGAGLGLSIVRSVAHAHHGDVHAHSRPDGGLRVHVRIPTNTRPANEPAGEDAD